MSETVLVAGIGAVAVIAQALINRSSMRRNRRQLEEMASNAARLVLAAELATFRAWQAEALNAIAGKVKAELPPLPPEPPVLT